MQTNTLTWLFRLNSYMEDKAWSVKYSCRVVLLEYLFGL